MPPKGNRQNTPIPENGETKMVESANASTDVWASAPDVPLIPFLDGDQRAELVNTRATLYVTGMEYDKNGRFGPAFVATFIVPNGDAFQYTFTTNGGKTPRDQTNKWIWTKINKEKNDRIPVQLCKRGRSYYFDKPGSETESDGSAGFMPGSGAANDLDVPDF